MAGAYFIASIIALVVAAFHFGTLDFWVFMGMSYGLSAYGQLEELKAKARAVLNA